MDELLDTIDAARILNMPLTTLNLWIRQGIIRPRLSGRGRGSTKVLAIRQCWAIGLARSIRKGGASVELAFCVARVLEIIPTRDIEDAFRRGANCLMICRVDERHTVLPRLVEAATIAENPIIDAAVADAAEHGIRAKCYGLNVQPMLQQIYNRWLRLRDIPANN